MPAVRGFAQILCSYVSQTLVYELVDFYHAVEHLGTVADLKKNWTKSEKSRLINKHRHLLLKGHADRVISAIDVLCRGRNSKGLSAERRYFVRNRQRMGEGP